MSSKTFTPSAVVECFEQSGFEVSKQARFYFRVYEPAYGTFVCGVHIDKKGEHIRLTTEARDAIVTEYKMIGFTIASMYSKQALAMDQLLKAAAQMALKHKDAV